jgi:3-deoxy-D-manno-octulosonic-acid transferase
VTGSLKFDGAQTDRNNEATRRLRQLAGFQDDDIIFLAGSTQSLEEQLALETFTALKDQHPRLKLILVPRHPHRFDEVAALLDRSDLPWQRRSQLPAPHSELRTPYSPPPTPSHILLIDTIGELSAWWGTATIGFVGGSLGTRGGQNMIEPAAYGVATCFGPNTRNFRDIVDLLFRSEGAVVVENGNALTDFVRRCLNDPDFTSNIGRRARDLVATQLGATRRTLSLLPNEMDECHDVPDRNKAA